jgi:hypothetical protein
MGAFNLDDYAPVEERIALFYADHELGRILTAVERLEPPLVVFRAEVYRDALDERPWATGYAYEKEGEGHVNRTSYIENCETSAIGRALANAGYHGKRDGAPRPSREEMEKVQRMGGTSASDAKAGKADDEMMPCPKCNGPMWDNRKDKKNPKGPDLKCKSKDCGEAIWLDGWQNDLMAEIAAAHSVEAIDAKERERAELAVESLVPAKMDAVQKWLNELAEKA